MDQENSSPPVERRTLIFDRFTLDITYRPDPAAERRVLEYLLDESPKKTPGK